MKAKVLILTFAAAILSAPALWAGSYRAGSAPAAPSSASGIVAFGGSMKGNFSSVLGKCSVGFSNQCMSSDCMCYTVSGTANLSRAGKGPATLYATLDFGSGATSGYYGDCFPVWGELIVNAPKDAESWDVVAYACDNVDGRGSPMQGGMVLGNSNLYSSAVGQFTILFNFAKGSCTMNFKGKAEW